MDIDIYIKETEGSRELRIPWLPDKVIYESNGTRYSTYEILDVGEVDVPSGRNLGRFRWESTFPGEGHKDLPFLRGTWQDPKKIQTLLSEWREYGTPLRLLMTGTPINHDVYLDDYDMEYAGGFGDYKYNIYFKKRSSIKITSSKVAVSTVSASGVSSNGSSSKTHTVKSGNTLWAIAQKYLGSGAKYRTIYELNKTIIEETAKKHGKSSSNGGHWIYPGTVLQIP